MTLGPPPSRPASRRSSGLRLLLKPDHGPEIAAPVTDAGNQQHGMLHERLVEAVGTVLRPGRTLTVCRGDVHIVGQDGDRTRVATVLTTMAARST